MWPFNKKKEKSSTLHLELNLAPLPGFTPGELDITFKLEVDREGKFTLVPNDKGEKYSCIFSPRL